MSQGVLKYVLNHATCQNRAGPGQAQSFGRAGVSVTLTGMAKQKKNRWLKG